MRKADFIIVPSDFSGLMELTTMQEMRLFTIKDGAYYCYCVYVLRISRYSDFLSAVFINTGRKQSLASVLGIQKENWGEPRIFQR